MHKNTVQRWESGAETDPQAVQIVAVARALETSVEWLREGGSEKPPVVVQVGAARAEGRAAPAIPREGTAGYSVAGFTARAREILEEMQQLQLELARELRALESGASVTPQQPPVSATSPGAEVQAIAARVDPVVQAHQAKTGKGSRRRQRPA